jgi:hypothetical protein
VTQVCGEEHASVSVRVTDDDRLIDVPAWTSPDTGFVITGIVLNILITPASLGTGSSRVVPAPKDANTDDLYFIRALVGGRDLG